MANIVWKAFNFEELFRLDSSYNTRTSNKDLNISLEKNEKKTLLLINKGGKNNGEEGFIEHLPQYKTRSKGLTLDDQFGNCFYHNTDFIMTGGGHINVVLWKDEKITNMSNRNTEIYYFMSLILRKIFQKSGIYGYMYKITDTRPNREIILLPVIEVKGTEEYIWAENGKYLTLAGDYIKELMDEAKIRKEEKTIRLYESEQKKYEAEQKKYEAAYLKEQISLAWKAFELWDLFDRNSSHSIKAQKKNLDESDVYDEMHTIKNITASKENKGCTGYLEDSGEVSEKKKINLLTIASDAAYGGVCFFQDDWFVSTGHNNILELKNQKMKSLLDAHLNIYYYLAKIVTKIMRLPGINRFMRSIGSDFNREIILLPVIEVKGTEEYVWEENGKYFTLAVNTMSYLYLQGQINIQQKKIDTYTYR